MSQGSVGISPTGNRVLKIHLNQSIMLDIVLLSYESNIHVEGHPLHECLQNPLISRS